MSSNLKQILKENDTLIIWTCCGLMALILFLPSTEANNVIQDILYSIGLLLILVIRPKNAVMYAGVLHAFSIILEYGGVGDIKLITGLAMRISGILSALILIYGVANKGENLLLKSMKYPALYVAAFLIIGTLLLIFLMKHWL